MIEHMQTRSTDSRLRQLAAELNVRIRRAAVHGETLARAIDGWMATDPIRLRAEIAPDRLSWELRVNLTAPPFAEWATQFDDAIHNLRATLDNLVWGIAILDGAVPKRQKALQFPIVMDRTDWKVEMRRIAELPQAVRVAIESVQPFQRSGQGDGTPEQDGLLLLNRLSNREKHRLAIQPSLSPEELAHRFGVQFRTEDEAKLNCPPDVHVSSDVFVDDAVLLRWATKTPIDKVKGEMNFKGKVVVDDDSIGPLGATTVLAQLCGYVPQVVNVILGSVQSAPNPATSSTG
jgi:hypothetical protein